MFADIAKPKVANRNMPTRFSMKKITINEYAATSRAKTTKLSTSGGKGKGQAKAIVSLEQSIDSDDIYATHLTTSDSESDKQEPQILGSNDDDLIATRRAKLCSKKMNDLSRIRNPHTTSSPPPVLE